MEMGFRLKGLPRFQKNPAAGGAMRSGLGNYSPAIKARGFARFSAALLVSSLAFLFACRHERELAQGQSAPPIQIESSSFTAGNAIPQKNTCDGAGLSPGLEWSVPPPGTKSVALLMHDPDAPADFTHWIVFNIPPGVQSLNEGASGQAAMPQGSSEGTNDFGRLGYGGPCPPGGKPHHYIFTIYALDARSQLPAGATRKQLEAAIGGHILAEGEIAGTYRRQNQ
jgi:hypothetical protein